VVSYTTVSPLPRRLSDRSRMVRRGGLFSVALSRGSPRVAVSHHLALWSPDVPRRCALPADPGPQHRRDRLTDSSIIQHRSVCHVDAHEVRAPSRHASITGPSRCRAHASDFELSLVDGLGAVDPPVRRPARRRLRRGSSSPTGGHSVQAALAAAPAGHVSQADCSIGRGSRGPGRAPQVSCRPGW
jgi:hypothetical protein